MKKIYFFDIDNTLLDHATFQIPPSALLAIENLKKEGHTIVVATGRSFEHALPFIQKVAPSFVITQNGALVLEAGKEGFVEVHKTPLDRARLCELFDWVRACGYGYGVNHGKESYISQMIPEITVTMDSVKMGYQSTRPFYENEDVYQAWLFFDETEDAHFFPKIKARFPEYALVRWHPKAIDVMPEGVNKWVACQWVLDQTGFSKDQAIAFGDGLNDLEMIEGAGFGVAMGNAHPELKAIADHVAPPLHENGVAHGIAHVKGIFSC